MSKWVPASAEELARRGIVPERVETAPEPTEQQEAKKPKRKSKAKE